MLKELHKSMMIPIRLVKWISGIRRNILRPGMRWYDDTSWK
jgi:hypothetical protein